MSRIDARNGAIGIVPEELDGAVVSNDFPAFNLLPDSVLPAFAGWLSKTHDFVDKCKKASEGTTNRVRLDVSRFLALTIPLPPLPEQRRIVARIEELAGKIEESHRLAMLAAEDLGRVYAARLGQLMNSRSGEWTRARVADVVISMDAGWSPQCDDIPAREGEWGVLKTTSVQWCCFVPSQNKVLPAHLEPIPDYAVRSGDVLVTRAGPRKRVGVVAAVREDAQRLTISDKLIRLRPDSHKVLPRFLELTLASPTSQEYLFRRKTGLADAQVNISQAILSATPIVYPQLAEQRQIVGKLDALQAKVDELKRLQAGTQKELDALMPSILDRAFKGEL